MTNLFDNHTAQLTEQIHLLRGLLAIELDAWTAYRELHAWMRHDDRRFEIARMRDSHHEHVVVLQRCLRDLGVHVPPAPADTGTEVMFFAAGDKRLISMWFREEEIARAYETALESRVLVPKVRQMLQRALHDEHRHYAWLASQVETRPRPGLH